MRFSWRLCFVWSQTLKQILAVSSTGCHLLPLLGHWSSVAKKKALTEWFTPVELERISEHGNKKNRRITRRPWSFCHEFPRLLRSQTWTRHALSKQCGLNDLMQKRWESRIEWLVIPLGWCDAYADDEDDGVVGICIYIYIYTYIYIYKCILHFL